MHKMAAGYCAKRPKLKLHVQVNNLCDIIQNRHSHIGRYDSFRAVYRD